MDRLAFVTAVCRLGTATGDMAVAGTEGNATYLLNLCYTNHSSASCLDAAVRTPSFTCVATTSIEQGNPLPYMACETGPFPSINLGSVLGVTELAQGLLNVTLAHGTPVRCMPRIQCFIATATQVNGTWRQTQILMVCTRDQDSQSAPHKPWSSPSIQTGATTYALVCDLSIIFYLCKSLYSNGTRRQRVSCACLPTLSNICPHACQVSKSSPLQSKTTAVAPSQLLIPSRARASLRVFQSVHTSPHIIRSPAPNELPPSGQAFVSGSSLLLVCSNRHITTHPSNAAQVSSGSAVQVLVDNFAASVALLVNTVAEADVVRTCTVLCRCISSTSSFAVMSCTGCGASNPVSIVLLFRVQHSDDGTLAAVVTGITNALTNPKYVCSPSLSLRLHHPS